MKKLFYFIGALVTAATIFAAIAVMLKRLKISLSIECVDDEELEGEANSDITVTVQNEECSADEAAEDDSDIAAEIEIELENLGDEEE